MRPTGGGGYTTPLPPPADHACPIRPVRPGYGAIRQRGGGSQVGWGLHHRSPQPSTPSPTTPQPTATWCGWLLGRTPRRCTMKQWVDIEGSGELTTKISFTGSGSFGTGTVVGASNAELRSLTVENTGGSTYAIAISNGRPACCTSPRSRRVGPPSTMACTTLNSSPPDDGREGHRFGRVRNSYGVYNGASSPTMTDVTATASGGTNNYWRVQLPVRSSHHDDEA